MIAVRDLCRDFHERRVLFDVSFEVGRGEIVGFLGPNGAGKTTVMRILTGFMTPTTGHVEVLGRTPGDEELSVRAEIGYLPETPPLYPDMRVCEFLDFVARIKGVEGSRRRSAVEAAVSECGLSGREKSLIRTLSKGYRQRVGLAQAIVHSPKLLILDEPGGGLDPKQRASLREILGGMAGRFTVLFSSHDLTMAAGVCSRYVIIDRGRIAGEGTREQLASRAGGSGRYVFVFRPSGKEIGADGPAGNIGADCFAGNIGADCFAGYLGAFIHENFDPRARVSLTPAGSAPSAMSVLEVETTADLRPAMVTRLVGLGAEIFEVRREEPDMENLFLHFTGGGAS